METLPKKRNARGCDTIDEYWLVGSKHHLAVPQSMQLILSPMELERKPYVTEKEGEKT